MYIYFNDNKLRTYYMSWIIGTVIKIWKKPIFLSVKLNMLNMLKHFIKNFNNDKFKKKIANLHYY